jgi:hypothetical protein
MESMMFFKIASAAILLGCLSMLSACDTQPVDPPAAAGAPAIGAASVALIAAMTDPCKLGPGDPFWKRYGGEDGYAEGYEQRCGHLPPD